MKPKLLNNVLKLDPKKRKKKIKGGDSSKKCIPDVPFLCQAKLTFLASAVAEIVLQLALTDRRENLARKLNCGLLDGYEVLNKVVSIEVVGQNGVEKIYVSIDVKKLAEFSEPNNGE